MKGILQASVFLSHCLVQLLRSSLSLSRDGNTSVDLLEEVNL